MAFETHGPLIPYDESPEALVGMKSENAEDGWMWGLDFIGQHMDHNYFLYHNLCNYIFRFPQTEIIVEFGTGTGALTVVLGLFGVLLGAEVYTVDDDFGACRNLCRVFERLNIKKSGRGEANALLRNKHRAYVICRTVEDLNHYAKVVAKDSVISALNYKVGILPEDIPQGLKPVMPNLANLMNCQYGAWRKC